MTFAASAARLMKNTAAAFSLLAVFLCTACQQVSKPATPPSPPPPSVAGSELLTPSPRLIVGRVIAVDGERGFATVELLRDAPAACAAPETELYARTAQLQPTAVLQTSRYLRGRILGTTILSGQPKLGDEVVWQTD